MRGICWAITYNETNSDSLTTGKRYMNIRWDGNGFSGDDNNHSMHILDDNGNECYILLGDDAGCAYLVDGGRWNIIKPTENGEVMYYCTAEGLIEC